MSTIPTTKGDMSAGGLLDELLYVNYSHNRDTAPHLTPEQYKRCGYPMVDQLEARYQAEKAIAKAAS